MSLRGASMASDEAISKRQDYYRDCFVSGHASSSQRHMMNPKTPPVRLWRKPHNQKPPLCGGFVVYSDLLPLALIDTVLRRGVHA